MQQFATTQTHTNLGQTDLLLGTTMNLFDHNSYLQLAQKFQKDFLNTIRFLYSLVTIHGRTNWH